MPATPTYVALAEVTLAATATEVTLPVPTGYRDLILVVEGTLTAGADIFLKANGSSSNWTYVAMYGPVSSFSGSNSYISNQNTNRFMITVQALDVSATDKHKTFLTRNSSAGKSEVGAFASRWADTSAITSLSVYTGANAFATGTTLNLYGIEA